MLDEKPNKAAHWKVRLEELDSLPGELLLNKTEVWEKLHVRLNGISSNRRRKSYWIAAACILALFIYLPVGRKMRAPAVMTDAAKVQKNSPAVSESFRVKDKAAISDKSLVTDKVKPGKQAAGRWKLSTKAAVKQNEPENNSSVTVRSKEVPELTVSAPALLDTPLSNTVRIVAVKKKLRVVHINDIGAPVEDLPTDTRSAAHLSLYRDFANQDVFNNTAVSTQSFKNGFLKIKNTLQN